jgi:uncharacterized membrane protein YcaP (DUF421 family)
VGSGQDIHLSDWHRILFGDAPGVITVEILIRGVVLLVALLAVVRLLGKRMNGQLTIAEMAVLLTLGAIAGNGMEIPQRGILQAVFVFACAWAFQRGITWIEVKSPGFERRTQGTASILVKNGVLETGAMIETRISHDQIYAMLRERGIFNLARAKRVYLEACGVFSVYEESAEKPGLCLLPNVDGQIQQRRRAAADGVFACKSCGYTQSIAAECECPNCGAVKWDPAVL